MLMHILEWKEELQSNLTMVAVGYSAPAVLQWITRCWADGVRMQELADSKGFEALDQNLSYGMIKMVRG